MNNIIVKTTILTAEEFQKQNDALSFYAIRLLILLIISAIILYGTDYMYKKAKNPLTLLINKLQKTLTTCILAAFAWYSVIALSYPLHNEAGKTKVQREANLSEIKEHIKINENKLTIEPLPENYAYIKSHLDENTSHTFKIHESSEEYNIKLIDSNNNKYEITPDQLDELKK